MARKVLLVCGIFSSLFYFGLNIFVPMQWADYSSVSQTVSELSAIDAPTRSLWVWLSTPYTLLVVAFAWGVWKSAAHNHALRVSAGLLIAYAGLGLLWPFFPMHLREVLAAGGATFSDTMHIGLAVATEILFLLALGSAAVALDRPFRLYSMVTFALLIVFGVLTFWEAPNVGANLPTPWIGVWERINIGVFLLWIVVLTLTLLRSPERKPPRPLSEHR